MARGIYSDSSELTSFVHSTDFSRGFKLDLEGSGFSSIKGIVSREGNIVTFHFSAESITGLALEIVLPYMAYKFSGSFYGVVVSEAFPPTTILTLLGGKKELYTTDSLGAQVAATGTKPIIGHLVYVCGLFNIK